MLKNFEERITRPEFKRTCGHLDVMQVNLGRLCNLACKHCHVDAGLDRTEIMTQDIMRHVMRVFKAWGFKTIDITGGAPEMNPNFVWLLDEAVKAGAHVIVRSNLVILNEPEYERLPELFAANGVEIAASLPYYTERDCDRQRGDGTFKSVIKVLKRLNGLGYGRDEDLTLDLVYNPGGAFLPPGQNDLEQEYRKRLSDEYGIEFTRLFAITNNPIGRFKNFLVRTGNFDRYMQRLSDAFNPAALEGMMCRFQLSVAWDGGLYDCDFNQALGLKINGPANIRDLGDEPEERGIVFGQHCYACTAGAGSSCGGTTA